MQFISAFFGAILGIRKSDFHLVAMKTNGKPMDKHPDKKKTVFHLSMIITFFHILHWSSISNFTYLSKMVQLLSPHQEINAYSAQFQSCLRFIRDIQNRKREVVIAATDMVFVLRFQKIRTVAQNLPGSTAGWVYTQTSWHRRSKNGQKNFPITQELNCRLHKWTITAKPINLIHVTTG